MNILMILLNFIKRIVALCKTCNELVERRGKMQRE